MKSVGFRAILMMLLVASVSAEAQDCTPLSGLDRTVLSVDDPFVSQTVTESKVRAEYRAAELVAEEFLAGRHRFSEYLACVQNYDESQRFLFTFQSVLIKMSLDRLRSSRSLRIRAFVSKVDAKSANGEELTIRLTGHGFGLKPVDKKAGYHRLNQSIFLDLDAVEAHEWLVILIHELSHYLDSQIYAAMKVYADPDLVKVVANISQRTSNPMELSGLERAKLDQWLMAGLDAGLLAEYRAWAVTDWLYHDGLREGLIQHVGWMDTFDRQLGVAAIPWPELMGYLEKRALNPKHALFEWPLVHAELMNLRRDLVVHPPGFGVLKPLFTVLQGF